MISHGLTIVINELKKHLEDVYNIPQSESAVIPGNIGVGFESGGSTCFSGDKIVFTLVNIREEKAIKNLPENARHNAKMSIAHENPPIFLNYQILITATHADYTQALIMLERVIRFFQSKCLFTHDNVTPSSMLINAPANNHDRLESFKLIFELCSLTLEEVNHLWGPLGSKQYPFVLYYLRIHNL
jgi:hypothetical protein